MNRAGLVLALCYPALVYFGSRHLHPAWLALALVPLALLRGARQPGQWLVVAAIGALGVAAVTLHSHVPLKLYPVLMNGALLALFAASLWRGPSVAERLARARHGELPPRAIAYTRRVTQAWCVFFVVNGTIALATVVGGSDAVWFWYNGVLAYVLIGSMFAAEWLCRRRVMRDESP